MTPVSAVVATTHPWPAVQQCIEVLVSQAASIGAEIILADSTSRGLPDPLPEALRGVKWLRLPGASVFELRARATCASAGDIVAWTEDHCRPANCWLRAILAAHQRHARADAVAGAVQNGSTRKLMDWANFFTTFGPFLAPFNQEIVSRVPSAANVSFKRAVLPPGPIRPGWIEFDLNPRLWAERRLAFDPSVVVEHIQSKGVRGTFAAHFHNGRSTTGLLAERQSNRFRLKRTLLATAVPAAVVIGAVQAVRGNPRVRGPLVASLPLIAALGLVHAAGELTGIALKGPGNSPIRIE